MNTATKYIWSEKVGKSITVHEVHLILRNHFIKQNYYYYKDNSIKILSEKFHIILRSVKQKIFLLQMFALVVLSQEYIM